MRRTFILVISAFVSMLSLPLIARASSLQIRPVLTALQKESTLQQTSFILNTLGLAYLTAEKFAHTERLLPEVAFYSAADRLFAKVLNKKSGFLMLVTPSSMPTEYASSVAFGEQVAELSYALSKETQQKESASVTQSRSAIEADWITPWMNAALGAGETLQLEEKDLLITTASLQRFLIQDLPRDERYAQLEKNHERKLFIAAAASEFLSAALNGDLGFWKTSREQLLSLIKSKQLTRKRGDEILARGKTFGGYAYAKHLRRLSLQ